MKSDISAFDSYLFHEGTHYSMYEKLGAHVCTKNKKPGTVFSVWAPNAKAVTVICSRFNWEEHEIPMKRIGDGFWSVFVPQVTDGDLYRYKIKGCDGITRYKADPYARFSELRPSSASVVVSDDKYHWNDRAYRCRKKDVLDLPVSIYEVQLGSWKRKMSGEHDGFYTYRQLAPMLKEYCVFMGYTYVELMGICEYPFDGSWGYQVTGYFSPTSRYGSGNDLKYLIDTLHQAGIGVILDWVPAHFPKDSFSLGEFDGSHLYESEDPLRREYPEWGTYAFNHARPEVRSFLISSAFYWIREFHVDALRVDAVAAMLYLNFSRPAYQPNCFGGNKNLESIDFIKQLNHAVSTQTNAFMIAEDSSIEEGITKSVEEGGLGFKFKWNLGWMNDSLKYMKRDPVYRRYHHIEITSPFHYSFLEYYILVLSHDEVVHLKKSMIGKMPGTFADKVGNLKAFYTMQYTQPGKKLLFMGQEFGQDSEWNENKEISWELAEDAGHRDLMLTVKRLNEVYRSTAVLFTDTLRESGLEWINDHDNERNILSYIRKGGDTYKNALVIVINLSRTQYYNYQTGVPAAGKYVRIFSTYDNIPGQGGPLEMKGYPEVLSKPGECDQRPQHITYSLRPNEAVIFQFAGSKKGRRK